MATPINEISRVNQFIKSSVDDYQDPIFLTFAIDFFPIEKQYPMGDRLLNSALLKPKNGSDLIDEKNREVEFSAIKWLNEYYQGFDHPRRDPAVALARMHSNLKLVQDSPWYFQSITGIGDLWNRSYNVERGNKLTKITINAVDSIKQPLTEIAEDYMTAVYDQDRLSYRLPDNLRWFDMTIALFEIRNIQDYSNNFFQYDERGNLISGLNVVKFNCKMCEFDFTNFLDGSISEHTIYNNEKPLSPRVDINIGWVEQERITLGEGEDYRKMALVGGVLDTLNNRLSRFIQNATRLPGEIIGSVLNEVQTFAEVKTMGNIYTGANAALTNMRNIPGRLTGRNPIVGPPNSSSVGDDIYQDINTPKVDNIGNVY